MSPGLYAALYDAIMWAVERFYLGGLRRQLLQSATGKVLEIGAGTGANLPHYGPQSRPVLSEPDMAMLRRARPGSTPAVLAAGEHLSFAAGAFDTVVSTLVLCSVADPAQTLAEIRRVLRPGGALLLIEHVRSVYPGIARLQTRMTPGWMKIVRGCHLDRDTQRALSAAGFRIESLRRLAPVPILPLIVARAVAPL